MANLVVKQSRSKIGSNPNVRRILRALGLGRIGQSRVHKDNNCVRGMVNKVRHLIEVELVAE